MKEFLTRWSIKHPVIVAALYASVLLLSILVLLGLPVRMMPYVESPLVAVITQAPGTARKK